MNPADLKLPDDVDALKALLLSTRAEAARLEAEVAALNPLKLEVAELKAINATADERIARLTSIIKMFERARYGKRSEKLRIDPLEDEQYAFVFDEVETGLAEIEAGLDKLRGKSGTARAPRPRKGFAAHLERIEVVLEPEDPPGCEGLEKVRIGEDSSEGLDVIPVRFRVIVIEARKRSRVEEFMGQIDQRHKTIVFCATQAHAGRVRDYINQIKTNLDPNYCQRVTASDGKLGEEHLRTFQDNTKTIPTILTTSQKLSTGVDARNVRNIVLMRPVRSMIEFKQIIGRGTRTFEGKDFFTIYDFVKAYEHFADPEWDGEPLEPVQASSRAATVSGHGEFDEPSVGYDSEESPQKVVIKLADGKARNIRYVAAITYWSPDGRPISAQQFMERMFGDLSGLVSSEDELRAKWSDPSTRAHFLQVLEERGYCADRLNDMRLLINARDSDIFDVLAYVRFSLDPKTHAQRADQARAGGPSSYETEMCDFLNHVLTAYEVEGTAELDLSNISHFLRIKYGSTSDGKRVLGELGAIRGAFIDVQGHLYRE